MARARGDAALKRRVRELEAELAKARRQRDAAYADGRSTDLDADVVARVSGDTDFKLPGDGPQGWMGPGQPIGPVAQQVRGRTWDFPVGSNVTTQPRQYEAITEQQLRSLADNCDLLRLFIETRKDQVEAYDWEIVPEGDLKASPALQAEADRWTEFLRHPSAEADFAGWMRKMLDDLFVIDAVVVFPRMTEGGDLLSLEVLDGGRIKRVLDEWGMTPVPPAPAFQQVLKGVPAVDFHADELAYFMRNARTYKTYGFSPVEQILITVNTAIRRSLWQLQYFTEGNIPEAIISMPETWTVPQVREFQDYWDSLLEGNTAQRRHAKFVPGALKFQETKDPTLKDMYDEWLVRIIAFAFSISPQPFIKEMNRATAQSNLEQAKLEGLAPLMKWLRNKVNFLLRKWGGMKGVEFRWKMDEAVDPLTQAQMDQIYLTTGVVDPNEVRERLGYDQRTNASADIAGPREATWPSGPHEGAQAADAPNQGHAGMGSKEGEGAETEVAGGERPDAGKVVHSDGRTEVHVHLGKTVLAPTVNVPDVNVLVESPEINLLVEK